MQTFLIIDGQTGRVIGASSSTAPYYAPGDHEIPCAPEQYADPTGWMRRGDEWVPAEPLPVPVVPVPLSVSSAQAKIALKRAGYLPAVRAIIDALGDDEVEIWFTDARVWERANPHVLAMARALDLSEAEVDELFATASLIAA